MGTPVRTGAISVMPSPSGVTAQSRFDGTKISIAPEYSNQTGVSLGVALATMLGDKAAIGVLLNTGADKREYLLNAGFKLDERQRFIISAGQLKQFLDYAFTSGTEKAEMTQYSGGVSYQLQLGNEFLRYLEASGYLSKTASRDLADKTFVIDSATLYELWNDPRRIAGGQVSGLQGKLGFAPLAGSTVKVSLGYEHLSYDLLAGKDSINRPTGGLEWQQKIGHGYQLKLGAESFAAQQRYTVGIERSIADGTAGRHSLGLNLIGLQGRDGLGNDNRFQMTYSYLFGGSSNGTLGTTGNLNRANSANTDPASRMASGNAVPSRNASGATFGGNLLDQVAMRPSYLPGQVLAKIDKTALPTRLIAVDKTALPAGASINAAIGDITVPLGIAVTSIASITRNLAAFINSGQYSLSGNNLLIKPSLIVQPAVGTTDTYVITLNNQGGGTTLATILVSHGSVKIDSIVITTNAGDTTAPTTTAAPSVSGTTATGTTLSATINEGGTGYYLVQLATAAAPSVAAVQGGTSFAMTANTAASPVITGLTAATAYKIYFVAKDAANNVQATVQSVAVTTTAAPDVTAPSTTAAPSISVAATASTASVTQTINETGTGYYLVQLATAAAPSVAAVKAGTAFAMVANVPAVVSLTGLTASTAYSYYFVAKDAVNNEQATVSAGLAITTTAAPDITAPTTTAALSVSGTTGGGTTLSVTINEAGTGYYRVLPAADAAPSVATLQTSTRFAMTANVAASLAITGLTAGTAYKIYFVAKDAANNVQATVQSVAVTTATGTISQGGLTWMPNNSGPWADINGFGTPGYTDWSTANNYCASASINGQTGWRLPTQAELSSLRSSGALAGQGWTLDNTWSSAVDGSSVPPSHYYVNLQGGQVYSAFFDEAGYVTCVRPDSSNS